MSDLKRHKSMYWWQQQQRRQQDELFQTDWHSR